MMNILSLFDGVSACALALERAGHTVDTYYTAEIDKFPSRISKYRYPAQVALGDVTKWEEWDIDWGSIDMVTGGNPCQSWSLAGRQLGDKDPRGMLFWTMLDIMKNVLKHNPDAIIFIENVKMKAEFERYITYHVTNELGQTIYKHLLNSALVSAQNRNRYYWTNIRGIERPNDKGIILHDIIEGDGDGGVKCGAFRGRYIVDGVRQDHHTKTAGLTTQRLEIRNDEKTNTLTTVQKDNVLIYLPNESATNDHKSYCLTARYDGAVAWNSCQKKQRTVVPIGFDSKEEYDPWVYNGIRYRKFTPRECERLQTFPDDWTKFGIHEDTGEVVEMSNSQRYKAIGNSWTVDMIAHIFSYIHINKTNGENDE